MERNPEEGSLSPHSGPSFLPRCFPEHLQGPRPSAGADRSRLGPVLVEMCCGGDTVHRTRGAWVYSPGMGKGREGCHLFTQ